MLKNLLLLSSFSAFVVVVLIGLEIYHNFSTSSLSSRTQTRIESIPPNFDKETLESLKERVPVVVDLSESTNVISEDTQGSPSIPTPSIGTDQVATGSSTSL